MVNSCYLTEPVVVAEFEQTGEQAFGPGPHELLPLPHILLKQVLPAQLHLALVLGHRLLACRGEHPAVTSFNWFTFILILWLKKLHLHRAGRHFFQASYEALGSFFSQS